MCLLDLEAFAKLCVQMFYEVKACCWYQSVHNASKGPPSVLQGLRRVLYRYGICREPLEDPWGTLGSTMKTYMGSVEDPWRTSEDPLEDAWKHDEKEHGMFRLLWEDFVGVL